MGEGIPNHRCYCKILKGKREKINEIDKKIENIAKMDLISYIKHINREEKEDEEINKDVDIFFEHTLNLIFFSIFAPT